MCICVSYDFTFCVTVLMWACICLSVLESVHVFMTVWCCFCEFYMSVCKYMCFVCVLKYAPIYDMCINDIIYVGLFVCFLLLVYVGLSLSINIVCLMSLSKWYDVKTIILSPSVDKFEFWLINEYLIINFKGEFRKNSFDCMEIF